jgi:hypothetical protein
MVPLALIIGVVVAWRYANVRRYGGTYSSAAWVLGAALLVASALTFADLFVLPVAAVILWLAARPASFFDRREVLGQASR